MIITIGGLIASGKTTLAKKISAKFNFEHISAGKIMRDMAAERGMSVVEFSIYAQGNHEIDNEIDRLQKERAQKAQNCGVDGRISAFILKPDLGIWLKAPLATRVKRAMLRDNSKDEIEIIGREDSEKKRYSEIYGINLNNTEIYDLIIDTEKFGIGETTDIAIAAIETYIRNHN